MIVDASALLAIILSEPEGDRFLEALGTAAAASMSIVNFVEAGIKVDKHSDPRRAAALDELISTFAVALDPVTAEQGRVARQAHKRFGRGSKHPARLNLGDCFAYALAKTRGEPLLFKGDDFAHPDVLAEIGSAL